MRTPGRSSGKPGCLVVRGHPPGAEAELEAAAGEEVEGGRLLRDHDRVAVVVGQHHRPDVQRAWWRRRPPSARGAGPALVEVVGHGERRPAEVLDLAGQRGPAAPVGRAPALEAEAERVHAARRAGGRRAARPARCAGGPRPASIGRHPELGALAGQLGHASRGPAASGRRRRDRGRRAAARPVATKSGTTTTPARPRMASAAGGDRDGREGDDDLGLHGGGQVVLEHAGLAGHQEHVAVGVEGGAGVGGGAVGRGRGGGRLGERAGADDAEPLAVERARARRGRRRRRSRRSRSGRRRWRAASAFGEAGQVAG